MSHYHGTRQNSGNNFKIAFQIVSHMAGRHDLRSVRNRFEVTTDQLDELQSILYEHYDEFYLLQNSPFEWAKFILTYDAFFIHPQHKEDLMKRADILLRGAIHKGYRDLVYMDGHGRFTACLLYIMNKNGWENNFDNLYCVELDHAMNQWHEILFPKIIKCKHSDIFSFLNNYSDQNAPFVYFNFCGMGEDVRFALCFLITSPDAMISFSNRCSCKENVSCVKCESDIFNFCLEHHIEWYTNQTNKHFHTFLLVE